MTAVDSYFSGKTVLITGASGGLGRAICHLIGKFKANIIALDLDEKSLQILGEQMKERSVPIRTLICDITDQKACGQSVVEGIKHFGGLDILINNAGITHFSKFEETETSTLQKVMDVNFFGAVNMTQSALPEILKNKGDIVSISSVAGFSPLYGRCGYAASKHAMEGFFSSLRSEIKEKGVNVLSINPSFIASQISTQSSSNKNDHTARPGLASQTIGQPLTSEYVAQQICRGIAQRKSRLVIGKLAKQSYWLQKLFPALFEKLMTKKIKPEFKGRS